MGPDEIIAVVLRCACASSMVNVMANGQKQQNKGGECDCDLCYQYYGKENRDTFDSCLTFVTSYISHGMVFWVVVCSLS